MFAAAFSLAYFGHLRVGEFTLSKGNLASYIICNDDIEVDCVNIQLVPTIRR